MEIRQIGKAIASALLVPLVMGGYVQGYEGNSNASKGARKMEKIEQITWGEEIKEKYRRAVFLHSSEGVYGDGSKIYDRGYGIVIGKEYLTVEHWINFPQVIKKEINGKRREVNLTKINVYIDGKALRKIVNFRDVHDRSIYELPKELSGLENNLKMKEKVELKKGDEVFWWGNARGVFLDTGKPQYGEARIEFLPGESTLGLGFIGISKRFVRGDSGSLVVKKKTGEIVGMVRGSSRLADIGLVIPASDYIRLREGGALVENLLMMSAPYLKSLLTTPNFPNPSRDCDKQENKPKNQIPQFKYSNEEIQEFIRNHPIR